MKITPFLVSAGLWGIVAIVAIFRWDIPVVFISIGASVFSYFIYKKQLK